MTSYTLSQLANIIGDTLDQELDRTYWISAEIASLSIKGGHAYLDLIEPGTGNTYSAKMRATCWSSTYALLSPYFEQETGSALHAGIQILVEVTVTFHAVYGLSLNIVNIDPQYTVGNMARQRQLTIQQLTDEGVIDLQRQLRLPTLIRHIAVISAETAAGFGDFSGQLSQSPYRFTTTLYPAIMQGDRAAQSILDALIEVERDSERYDAIVIIRGGGATTDLSCFDDYTLAAACAQMSLPVLTGIGHLRDVSVLDIVAHLSLKTPTAVAAFLVDRMAAEEERIARLRKALQQTAEKQILIRRHRIELLRQRLQLASPERIFSMGYSLTTADGQVIRSIKQVTSDQVLTIHLLDGDIEVRVL